MTDISTNVLEKILEEFAIIVSLESDLVRNQDQILSSIKKISWRSSELISGARFKIRDVIFERDWDCIDYLKIMISSGATNEIISNLAEYIADLRNLSIKLTSIIDGSLLNRIEQIDSAIIPTCIPTIARISGFHLDMESLRKLDEVLSIINANYDNTNVFCRKAVLRTLEILGEYSKKLSETTKSKFLGIPWLSVGNEGGNLGSLRNIAEHPRSFQKDIFDSLCDDCADNTIQQIMRDLEEFHGRLKNYLSAPGSEQLAYSMPEITKLYQKLTTLPKQTKSFPVVPFTNELEEVQKIMRIHLDKDGATYRDLSILFQDTFDESAVRTLLASKSFNIVADSKMRDYKGHPAYIAQSLLKKKEKILLKVLDVKFVQIRKVFSNEEVTSIINLKKELVEFLVIEDSAIDNQLQTITLLIKISPIALLEQYRLPNNGNKIDELIRIINKELKVSSVVELKRKLEDIVPPTIEKDVILTDLLNKLRDCIETVSYTEKAIREIDYLINIVEESHLAGVITSYEQLLHSQSIYYFAVQLIIEQIGMVAKDLRPDTAGIEFKVSNYETISPRRMLLIKIFRDLIAHYPERVDENIVKVFFRDLVAFTKLDIQRRTSEINSGIDIWLCELLQPTEIREITEEVLETHQGSIFAIIRDMGFKSSVKIIGRVVGSEIASRATLDILVEFNEGVDINPLKIFELELVLGNILNSYIKVHTKESLETRIGIDYTDADYLQITIESISLVEMMQSVSFKRQFVKGNVENFLLPNGVLVVKSDPNFTLKNIAKAKHMTFLSDEEDDAHQREYMLRTRKKELEDFRIISLIKNKAQLLAGYISQKLASIDGREKKLFLELIKIDKELDALIDAYFVEHRKDIFVFLNKQNLKATTKQGFRDYVKKTLPTQLEKDFSILVSYITDKCQKKYSKMAQIQAIHLKQETNLDDWILEDMILEFKVQSLISFVHRYEMPQSEVSFAISQSEIKMYASYVVYRDLKFLFDEIDASEVVDAFIAAMETHGESQIMTKIIQALNDKFIDLDNFVMEFLNNRATGGYKYMKSPFYDEVQSELTYDDIESPYERLRSKDLKLIISQVNYECLSKIRALKDFIQKKPNSVTSMHEVEAITFSRLSEIEGSKCDKIQLLKGTASTFLVPTILDLDEVARIFGVEEADLDRYVGGKENYEKDKAKFYQYRKFILDQNILENIIVNMDFYQKKNIDINQRLSITGIDDGTRYVLNTELTKNKAIICYLKTGINFYSKLQIRSSFFMDNVNHEIGEERIKTLAETQLLQLFVDIAINKLQFLEKLLILSTVAEVRSVVYISASTGLTNYGDSTNSESNEQQSPKYNIELAESMLYIRNGIEFIPVFSYFTKNIVYPITKNVLPVKIANVNLPEIHSALLSIGHVGASYIGALALSIDTPLVSALTVSLSYNVRLVLKEVVHNLASVDLSNNINMASYCMTNTAFHFVPELMQLYYFINIGQLVYGRKVIEALLKANSLTITQRLTTASLECYNTYKQVHDLEEKIETKIEKIFPYIADAVVTVRSFTTSYNPFFVIGSVVAVDISSKIMLKAIPTNIKTSIDLGLTCLGVTEDISNTFINIYYTYWKKTENTYSLKTYQSCQALAESFIEIKWLKNIYDYTSYRTYYLNKVIIMLEVRKNQDSAESKNALAEEFGNQKAEYIFNYVTKPGLDIKYELLEQVASGIITETEYNNKLQSLNFSIDIENIHYDLCVKLNINISQDNDTMHYNCYSKEAEIVDHIIIVSDKLVELYNLYSE